MAKRKKLVSEEKPKAPKKKKTKAPPQYKVLKGALLFRSKLYVEGAVLPGVPKHLKEHLEQGILGKV